MVAVLSNTGIRLMPTSNYKARKLLASGRAVKERYSPVFTIRLLDRNDGVTQPIAYDSDTGAIHVGISIKSQKHEYVSEQRDLLANETERHDARRKYRRQRRNRLRYRKPRFENRRASKKEGWFPPSVRNRMNQQIRLFEQYAEVIPITQATFEMGSFDTQLLQAIESGKPAPKGTDYQQGPRYRTETLRQAVFLRDGYQCCFCGRGIKEHAKLHVHHLGFRRGDHTDRMSNLATACETCHTPKNHKPGGILYDAKPKLKPFKGAAFMTAVRWKMWNMLKASRVDVKFRITYGVRTKLIRQKLHMEKSHANDAYAIGNFHPKHRVKTVCLQKRRRNNRRLEKFYDAKYIDSRTGKKASGQELFSGRSKRNQNLSGENLHRCRKRKVSAGKRVIRTRHYEIQPGTILSFEGKRHIAKGIHCNGTRVILENGKSVSVSKVIIIKYGGGWITARKGEQESESGCG